MSWCLGYCSGSEFPRVVASVGFGCLFQEENEGEKKEEEEPDMWEETYSSHTDSKPNGKKNTPTHSGLCCL